MKYAVEMASCGILFIQGFMKIGTGVQGTLRRFNVGIMDVRDLLSTSLRWAYVE
jgi:hypothetical protein